MGAGAVACADKVEVLTIFVDPATTTADTLLDTDILDGEWELRNWKLIPDGQPQSLLIDNFVVKTDAVGLGSAKIEFDTEEKQLTETGPFVLWLEVDGLPLHRWYTTSIVETEGTITRMELKRICWYDHDSYTRSRIWLNSDRYRTLVKVMCRDHTSIPT